MKKPLWQPLSSLAVVTLYFLLFLIFFGLFFGVFGRVLGEVWGKLREGFCEVF